MSEHYIDFNSFMYQLRCVVSKKNWEGFISLLEICLEGVLGFDNDEVDYILIEAYNKVSEFPVEDRVYVGKIKEFHESHSVFKCTPLMTAIRVFEKLYWVPLIGLFFHRFTCNEYVGSEDGGDMEISIPVFIHFSQHVHDQIMKKVPISCSCVVRRYIELAYVYDSDNLSGEGGIVGRTHTFSEHLRKMYSVYTLEHLQLVDDVPGEQWEADFFDEFLTLQCSSLAIRTVNHGFWRALAHNPAQFTYLKKMQISLCEPAGFDRYDPMVSWIEKCVRACHLLPNLSVIELDGSLSGTIFHSQFNRLISTYVEDRGGMEFQSYTLFSNLSHCIITVGSMHIESYRQFCDSVVNILCSYTELTLEIRLNTQDYAYILQKNVYIKSFDCVARLVISVCS